MIRLKIDGVEHEFPEGKSLLECLNATGANIPTLCFHKALSAYGACRLCLVEVQQNGRAAMLQASCSYPAMDGLSVHTDTERVRRARKIMAELLLARCPDSAQIQRIAAEQGVTAPRIAAKYDDCIYCGLCVRMCQERMGRSAIGFTGRGPGKRLEPPFGKHNPLCWTCGACDFICPVGKKVSNLCSAGSPRPIANPHNLGLDARPVVHILYPQAVPNTPSIDPQRCVHLNYGACGVCETICEASAIDYTQTGERRDLEVGAVVLTPGFDLFDPAQKEELGYGRYPNVITSLEFERILSASGPFAGAVRRPHDMKTVGRIAFIQCVGSREKERDYCSSVCCMAATKEALIAKEHVGENLICDIYFMDVRAFGKGFDEYYQRALSQGVHYIRCRIPAVEEIPESHNLLITYLDENEVKRAQEYDLVVLSVGMVAPGTAQQLAEKFDIALNAYQFCETQPRNPVETTREGVFVAGPFTEPKDIPETVMQASGAASRVLALLHEERGSLIEPKIYPPERDVSGEAPRIGVFVCHCGTNIASVVNVPEVVAYARTLPEVVHADNNLYTCSNDTQELIKEQIQKHHLNRVVVASCTPRTHEPLFRNTVREAGLNPYLFEMANIRDQCSWVHMHEPEKATEKAKDLVRMAVAKARLLEPLESRSIGVHKAALVIGGGLAGMTAALSLADQGFPVYLVEREKELGGHLRELHDLLNGENPQAWLGDLIAQVDTHERIECLREARIEAIDGSVGNFKSKIAVNGETHEIDHGVVIVATGAKEYSPTEYFYGEDERVLTQLELENRLALQPDFLRQIDHGPAQTVVMIQCVGSRDAERPYCSRICCAAAIKNALKIKEQAPDTHVYILYRDIRTYGFREQYYTAARQQGVIFIRYDESSKPEVRRNGAALHVQVFDQTLQLPIQIAADFVVLSTGIVPDEDSRAVAQFLKVPLTQDGFFLEAHMKLRPVEFATDGVFVCGLAHSAKGVQESVIQAQAAAGRAAAILAKDRIELGATVSHVVNENCDGCAYCVGACPFGAITLIEYVRNGAVKKVVESNPSVCKGCGCCQATCPKKGIFIHGFRLDQIAAQVEAALAAA